jgi:uridylate kinase
MRTPSATEKRRILLKLSGEALSGGEGFGIDTDALGQICGDLADVSRAGVEIGVVIGGGIFFGGISAAEAGIDRASADYIGMLATVMNALALQQALTKLGLECRVQSAIPVSPVSEPFVRSRAIKHLQLGRIVIFAAGTGNPFFTTDTAASLRAAEIDADILIKATKVDGVYDKDPVNNPDAKKYDSISYDKVLRERLGVMDATAIALCRDNHLELRVMSVQEAGNLKRLLAGESVGTLISSEDKS